MANIDKIEQKIRRIDDDLAAARAKAEEWRCKVISLEKERENAENLRIVQIVRSTEISPDMLKTILSMKKSGAESFISTAALPHVLTEKQPVTANERTNDYEETL